MKIKINVTAADIKHGAKCDGGTCPVARALKRKLPTGFKRGRVHVTYRTAAIFYDAKALAAQLPERAANQIRAHDGQTPYQTAMTPFSCVLDLR